MNFEDLTILCEASETPLKPQISPEDKATLAKLKRDRVAIAGYHPEDDSPFASFADGYSGYTVRDSRNHMTRIKQDIESKYGITHTPSATTLQKQQEKANSAAKIRKDIDAQVRTQYPDLDTAYGVISAGEQYRYFKVPKYGYSEFLRPKDNAKRMEARKKAKAKMLRLLRSSPFGSCAQAAQYRATANKLKDQLLKKAKLRPSY